MRSQACPHPGRKNHIVPSEPIPKTGHPGLTPVLPIGYMYRQGEDISKIQGPGWSEKTENRPNPAPRPCLRPVSPLPQELPVDDDGGKPAALAAQDQPEAVPLKRSSPATTGSLPRSGISTNTPATAACACATTATRPSPACRWSTPWSAPTTTGRWWPGCSTASSSPPTDRRCRRRRRRSPSCPTDPGPAASRWRRRRSCTAGRRVTGWTRTGCTGWASACIWARSSSPVSHWSPATGSSSPCPPRPSGSADFRWRP